MTKILVATVVLFIAVGCGIKTVRTNDSEVIATSSVSAGASEPSPEVSLKADRSDLDQLRAEIPEELKRQNDEIALILSFINKDSEEEPNKVRDRFSAALRKRREALDKQLRRTRESFSKKEKQEREEFLKKSKAERVDFLESKRSPEDRKRFFEDQDDRRKSFFNDSAERRKDFESGVQDERKRMEDFTREKQNQFNQEWREYQTRYNERKKQNDLKKRMEQKARDLERRGQPVVPPGSSSNVSGSVVGGVSANIDSASSAGGRPVDPAPQRRATLESSPEDSLKEFDKIPQGPGISLTPGTAKKGN